MDSSAFHSQSHGAVVSPEEVCTGPSLPQMLGTWKDLLKPDEGVNYAYAGHEPI